MDCKTARLLVPFARSGGAELDPGEQHALHRHLADCTSCRREWNTQRRVDDVLAQAMQTVPLPNGLKDRVLARLEQERHQRYQRWLTSAAAALAAALCIGSFAYYYWPRLMDMLVRYEAAEVLPPDVQFRFPHEIVEDFEKQGYSIQLPRDLIRDWDFRLFHWADVMAYDGQFVPTLHFKNGAAGAWVHILRRGQFDPATLTALREANDPHRKVLGNPETDEFIAVVVLNPHAKIEDFHRPPERIAFVLNSHHTL